MDAVALNCVTHFNIVWRVWTFLFLPMSKCRRKTRHVTVAESLFLKNVSTANARCSSDQRCMMTEGFKPLYTAMCVSPHHLQWCRHGAKFKSSVSAPSCTHSFIRIQPRRPGLAGTRAQSCDRYGSGTLHPGQVLGGSLPLLSPALRRSCQLPLYIRCERS